MAPEGKHLCRRHTTGAIKRPEGGRGCASQSTPQLKCTPVLGFENVPECAFDLLPLPATPSHCPNRTPSDGTGIVARHWRIQLCLWPALCHYLALCCVLSAQSSRRTPCSNGVGQKRTIFMHPGNMPESQSIREMRHTIEEAHRARGILSL